MCGICGIYNYASDARASQAGIRSMMDSIAHRGPDGEGLYMDKSGAVGFGHRRLSIIDVESGTQPMSNEDGSVWITYNGEIYNFKELSDQLVTKGHRFRTRSDTEVLVHLYEEYGQDMLDMLNGIFAFAIWDGRNRRFLAARDHFGVKPFYYHDDGKSLRFGSEIKAILAYGDMERDVDLMALDMCLTFRYAPSPHTLLRNVRKLEPGECIICEKGKVRARRFSGRMPEINRGKRVEEWEAELSGVYGDATRRQMVSDVPIGISLSGGVDSGTILSAMARVSSGRVNAFTVGFEEGEKDNEIEAARALADMFGADFNSTIIKQKDYAELFARYMWHLEEPTGNESALAYYFVAELARGKVKVLLNGQGADEAFAGYPRHKGEKMSALFRPLGLLSTFPFGNEQMRRIFYSLPQADEAERFYRIYSIITDKMKGALYGPELRGVSVRGAARQFIYEWVRERATAGTGLEKMLYIDARTSLSDNLLLCEDKMSMACGIEARVPFLDREVMRVAETIPGRLKISSSGQKYIHKLACRGFLPEGTVHKRKIGFFNPMDKWLAGSMGELLTSYIDRKDSLTSRYLDPAGVKGCIEAHRRGSSDQKRILFLLLSLEKWYRIFILKEDKE
ncbi:MAG: asparagine synthase (glutamine-hydrolyzing) [Candidatus Omnitrophica bacterium]|nr:asparagine synthase (glutamine-hydrolyzing) [Candidatus Omnitrophota bacterium]